MVCTRNRTLEVQQRGQRQRALEEPGCQDGIEGLGLYIAVVIMGRYHLGDTAWYPRHHRPCSDLQTCAFSKSCPMLIMVR